MPANEHALPLHAIAHGRAGDKGNRLNVSVIAHEPEYWPILLEQVTEERVRDLFAHRLVTEVRRYEVPRLKALNFVIEDALEGGVNSSLGIDTHGKSLAYLVLGLTVEVSEDLSPRPHGMAGNISGLAGQIPTS